MSKNTRERSKPRSEQELIRDAVYVPPRRLRAGTLKALLVEIERRALEIITSERVTGELVLTFKSGYCTITGGPMTRVRTHAADPDVAE